MSIDLHRSVRVGLLLPACILTLAAAVLSVHPRAPQQLIISPADGRLLVAEALTHPGEFALTLDPGPGGLSVVGGRLNLSGTVQGPIPGSCRLQMSGTPVIAANRIALTGLTLASDGYPCRAALALAEARVRSSIESHPWDLAGRLARASNDPALPGPRLPQAGCLRADEIQLLAVQVRDQDLAVQLQLLPRADGATCP